MSLSYFEDGDQIFMEGEICPACGSTATLKEVGYGFWKCENCSTAWGSDDDDPDYQEADVCPHCGGHTSGILNSDWRRCDECLHDFLPLGGSSHADG